MTQTKIVNVAAGVLMRPDGHVLLAQRPAGKPYEGWWEFPGGKFEPGENAEVAVARELEEELGIRVLASSPWVVREHVYEHAHVRLFFRRITAWEGEPRGREGQQLAWCALDTVNLAPLLPASVDLIRWLQLSPVYAISD
ncbi:MAG: NUDIX domain-containing protein, partial [Lautropia sp.]